MNEENKQPHIPKPAVVETYAQDMAGALLDNKQGLIKKIIQEEEQREVEKDKLSPESKKNKIFMWAGIILVCLSVGAFSFLLFRKNNSTVPVASQFTPLIFVDQSAFAPIDDLTKDQINQVILSQASSSVLQEGGVEGIYPTLNKKVIGLREFVTLIKGNFMSADYGKDNQFVNDTFLVGAVDTAEADGSGKNIFILLKMRSFSDIFNSMHLWEDKMFADVHGLFGTEINAGTNYLLTKNFEDGIIQNKNARILYDNNKKIVLMYIFADDNSIVIAADEDAAQEVMLRLAASRVKK